MHLKDCATCRLAKVVLITCYINKEENDRRTKARLKDDRNGSVGCRFTCSLNPIFLFVGPTINNQIKNKKIEKNSSNIFVYLFSYLKRYPLILLPR